MTKFFKIALLAAAVLTVSGCAVVDHTVSKFNTQKTSNAVDSKFEAAMQSPTSGRVIENEGIWVNKRSVSMKEDVLPAVFKMPMTIGFEGRASLRDVANIVSRETGLRFSFAPDVLKEADVPMLNAKFRSENDLRQTLNQLTAQANMSWKYRGGGVEVFRFDTQVFQIAVLPGSTEFGSAVGNRNSSGGAAGAGSNGGVGGATASTTSGQDVKYTARLEFWKGLSNDLKNLTSRDGASAAFTVSEATNSVTVTATPPTLATIDSYVKDLNASRMRQVAIEVRAFTIDVASGRDFGLQWNLAYNKLSKDFGITSTLGQPADTALGTLSAVLGLNSSSSFAGTKLFMNALSTLGTTNLAVESTQMVLSGEAVPVNSMREVNYLSEVTTNAVANAGTSTSLKQSTVTEGFSMTLLPIILKGDSIMLKGFLDIASIDRIDTVSSGGQSISTPQRSTKSLPMTVSLKSGETYVYGLREALSNFSDSGITGTALINTLAGGQHGSKESKKTIVVAVTPYIVNAKN